MTKPRGNTLAEANGEGSANFSESSNHRTGSPDSGWSWPAPAKLNLFLHVVGRRHDGYHLLQTVFQFLDYGDDLEFSIRDDDRITITTNYSGIITGEDIVLRAAKQLQQDSNCVRGADIRVHKRLPIGGGLGGGSSNAATTLVALNSLWGTGLSTQNLAETGLKLGADVPVFVHGYAAWAEGIGEQLTPVDLPQNWFLVVSPGISIATAEIFNAPDLTRNTAAITIRDFLDGHGRNDCEPVARKSYPAVAEILDWLGERAPARMTGTGSCVYAMFSTEAEATRVLDSLPGYWQGFVARGINQSPLLDRLHREQSIKLKVES